MKPVRVNILGAGNVARQLVNEMAKYPAKIRITALWNRHPEKWKNTTLPVLEDLSRLPAADVHILVVKDDAIKTLSKQMPPVKGLVVHTSGVMPKEIIARERKGVFYPLQTLSAGRPVDWKKIPLLIEAERKEELTLLNGLAQILSDNVKITSHREREVLHVAAVFASNFTVWMYEAARQITGKADIPFELLLPLIEETAAKIQTVPPLEALTGPAKRNDRKTLERHLTFLRQNHPEWTEIYEKISKMISRHFLQ